MKSHRIPRRMSATMLCVAVAVLACLSFGSARADVAKISDPPPYATQAIPAADGPVVVEADPFSMRPAAGLSPGQIEMTTVSSPPSLITGDRARVEIRGVAGDDVLTVEHDGIEATAAFSPVQGSSDVRQGVVQGLRPGTNEIVATVTGPTYGTRTVTLIVESHPMSGPITSGEHQSPFVCETKESGMAPPTDPETCSVDTTYHWYYRSSATQQFVVLSKPADPYPPDVSTTIVNGKPVPFVVRVESAVVDRSITHIAVLDDPHARGASRFEPLEWNRRLVYVFGESCGRGHHQGVLHETTVLGDEASLQHSYNENYATSVTSADLPDRLGAGYMVAMSSLTTLMNACNPPLSAETLMMVKEHIVDDYGLVSHTIGVGGSGGAIQQYLAANDYPGLLDAATMIESFPDMTTVSTTIIDCHLLQRAFGADVTIEPPAAANPIFDYLPVSTKVSLSAKWNPAKQRSVTGLATARVCGDWDDAFYPIVRPTCDETDAAGNPYVSPSDGLRCSVQDEQRTVWGVDADGAANLPYDNTGVQYGLQAFRDEQISPDDFIALNRRIGGIDRDGNETKGRSSMDPLVAQIAYATGQLTGRGALDQIPIIDQAVGWLDYVPGIDVHDQQRPWQARARLDATFGSHANQAIFSVASLPARSIDVAEDWLNAVDRYMATHPGVLRAQAVAAARPSGTEDQCRVLVAGVPDSCVDGVARATSPRQAAGGPVSEDVLLCVLKPVDRRDYPKLTDGRWAAIQATFPQGVCDYSKPGVGAVARTQTWLSWASGGPGTTPQRIPWTAVRSQP